MHTTGGIPLALLVACVNVLTYTLAILLVPIPDVGAMDAFRACCCMGRCLAAIDRTAINYDDLGTVIP
jgi:hypothetical protein